MKQLNFFVLLGVLPMLSPATSAAEETIPETVFREAGLAKLSSAELEVLENWIRENKELMKAASLSGISVEELPQGEDAFGLEQIESRMARIINLDTDRIETRIVNDLNGWGGGTYFQLSNGQVWRQIDSSTFRYKLKDEEVIISRGMMGTYFLKPKAFNSKVRVQRVE